MEIDNDKRATAAKAVLISTPFILLLGTGLLAIFLLIHTWIPTIISGVLVLLGWGITVVLRLQSVKLRVSDDIISLFYYPMTPMTSNFKRIYIPTDKLSKYQIRSSLMGYRKELILYERIDGEDAAYPPVNITLFGKSGIHKIEEFLNSLCS